MIVLENNSFGDIKINREILDEIIEDSIKNIGGELLLATSKGRISKKYIAGNPPQTSITYLLDNGELEISIYLSFKFGSSIKKVTNRLSEDIFSSIRDNIGIKKIKLNMKIKGIVQDNIVKKSTDLELVFKNYGDKN